MIVVHAKNFELQQIVVKIPANLKIVKTLHLL
jgi:hypothetical protein